MDRRPPTPEELQSLTDAFQRDPAGHFVQLGESFLALGRPSDAVEVGARGLQAAPDNTAGRLMVGTAMAQLHRWKEAQAELLKVVKIDRNNRQGFRLLGEVLMRRNDYERALPVLQHAQNLNPSDSEILTLVRRARDGQPLDPPRPIPTQASVQGGGRDDFDDEAPTSMADAPPPPPPPRAQLALTPKPALGRVELQKKAVVRGGSPAGSAERVSASAARDARGAQAQSFAPVEIYKAPPSENPLAPMGSEAPAVRPRLIPAEKPKDAAQEGLRVSAAAGEQYLNQLLMGGLLDVPNVRVSQASYDVAPGKRWGRSSARMFIYLFVILGAAGAGSGVWSWYAQKQLEGFVDDRIEVARALIPNGDRVELTMAIGEVKKALERNPSDVYTMAVLAQVTAVSALLHGEYTPAEVQRAVDAASSEIVAPADKGYREVILARSAVTLAELPELESGADGRLVDARKQLSEWLERSPEDKFARWLLGRALLAAGDRRAAMDSFAKAHANGEGPAIAAVDLANYYLDEGDFDKAMKLYEAALAKSQNHDLAFVGRSLARSERRVESSEAMADISIGLAQAQGSALVAWKELSLASAQYALEDYEAFNEALDKATGPMEPRFLARVGLSRVQQGRIVVAAGVRGDIRWYAADPQLNPLVFALDAELYLARGLPKIALEAIGEQTGLRANSIRGRALFDMGKAEEALTVFEAALKDSPEDLELRVWAEASRMLATKGRDRKQADEALDSLGRKAKTKTARFIHGTALAAVGNTALAKDKLEQSVEDVSDAYPNALAYRSYLELARLTFAEGKNAEALKYLDKSVEHNPGYLPTRDMLGQVLLDSDPEKALKNLADVFDQGVASVGAELAYARALVKTGGSKDIAAGAIRRAKERGADVPSLQRAILDVDPDLFTELQIAPIDAAP